MSTKPKRLGPPSIRTQKKAGRNLPAPVAPPGPNDYLPSVIKKEVLRSSLTHPTTLYPTALGVGSALAGVILGWPWLYLVALAGLLGPISAVAQIFLFPDRIGKDYLASLDKRRAAYQKYTRELVRTGLEMPCEDPEAARLAQVGRLQFEKTAVTLESIRQVLRMKLVVRELTFQRFLGAAEQASLSVLDNLKSLVALLRSSGSIDSAYLLDRIKELEKKPTRNTAETDELATLEERLRLRRTQLDGIAALLSKNEEALTAMEHISARVAAWRTDAQFAASDIESAIEDLRRLAEYAQAMSNSFIPQGGK